MESHMNFENKIDAITKSLYLQNFQQYTQYPKTRL